MAWTTQEALGEQLGNRGSLFESGTDTHTVKIVAIHIISTAVFRDLIPAENNRWIGTVNGNGDNLGSLDSIPANAILRGRWTEFKLLSGKVIAYLGEF